MTTIFRPRDMALAVLCAALVGCSSREDPAALVASARKYLQSEDRKAAVIQLKNALQQQPELAEARYLLGRALLEQGEVAMAEVELRKALDLQHPAVELAPLMARVLLAQGKPKEVVERYASTTPAQADDLASVKTSLALAHAALGQREPSRAALQAALHADPDHVPARLLQVRSLLAEKDVDGAFARLDEVLAAHPRAHEAWLLKADMLNVLRSDRAGALAAWRKALELKADLLPAHAGIVTTLLGKGKREEAAAQLEQMRKLAPQHPYTKLFDAQLAFARADYKTAKELTLQLVRMLPEDLRVLQLAGALALREGDLSWASQHLAKALKLQPQLESARLLLVQTQLRSGEAAKALQTLKPLLDIGKPTVTALSLAAQAHQQSGDLDKAEALYKQAAAADPKNARTRTALALVHMARGDGGALDDLEAIADDDQGTVADRALITLQLRRKDYDAALRSLAALEKKTPGKPTAALLRGGVLLAQKKPAEARRQFEQALSIDPVHFPAAAALAQLDLADRKPEQARQRFEDILKKDPKQMQALLALGKLDGGDKGRQDEALRRLSDAVRFHPAEVQPRLALIDHHLRQRSTDQALAAARDAVAAIPDNPALVYALGRAEGAAGQTKQALASYAKLGEMRPDVVQPLLLQADTLMADKNEAEAMRVLKRALVQAPRDLEVQRRIGAIHLAAGRIDEARAVARSVQKQRPKEAVGLVMEGDVETVAKRWPEAAAAYRSALQKAEASVVAMKLHAALAAGPRKADAEVFATQWTTEHREDAAFLSYLAQAALMRRDFATAELQYRRVLELAPEHPLTLNNLAWVLAQLKKPGAVEMAEKLNQLRPDVPGFMDTLATALAADKQFPRAIEVQRKAIELDKDKSPGLRLALARIYIDAGQRAEARRELDRLAKLGDSFKEQKEVARLLEAISG